MPQYLDDGTFRALRPNDEYKEYDWDQYLYQSGYTTTSPTVDELVQDVLPRPIQRPIVVTVEQHHEHTYELVETNDPILLYGVNRPYTRYIDWRDVRARFIQLLIFLGVVVGVMLLLSWFVSTQFFQTDIQPLLALLLLMGGG